MSTSTRTRQTEDRDLIAEFDGYFVGEKFEADDTNFDAGLAALKETVGEDLPLEYVDFIRRYGLHGFEKTISFEDGTGQRDVIQVFLGFTRKNFGAYDINSTIATLGERLPPGYLPLALDPYGNLVCYNANDEALYFWNHEQVSDPADESEMMPIADSLDEFIDSLETSGEEDEDDS
jgi:hypothetical protein